MSCPWCAERTPGGFPEAVPPAVQYGTGVKALASYLMGYQLLPYARTQQLLRDLFAIAPSTGTLHQSLLELDRRLEPTEPVLPAALLEADVVHLDETGFCVNGQRQWLHVCSSGRWTSYRWHRKRGRAALEAMGLLASYAGVAVHDGWASYQGYGCAHALCNAHHLRELTFIEERTGQRWASEMKALLVELKAAVAAAQARGAVVLEASVLAEFQGRYRRIVAEGLAANPPPVRVRGPAGQKRRGRLKQTKAKNLVDRRGKYEVQVWRFAFDFRVPFDNNQAERDLRMMKLKQKISGGFRTPAGAERFCRLRRYVSTVRKQGHAILEALEAVFNAEPGRLALLAE